MQILKISVLKSKIKIKSKTYIYNIVKESKKEFAYL